MSVYSLSVSIAVFYALICKISVRMSSNLDEFQFNEHPSRLNFLKDIFAHYLFSSLTSCSIISSKLPHHRTFIQLSAIECNKTKKKFPLWCRKKYNKIHLCFLVHPRKAIANTWTQWNAFQFAFLWKIAPTELAQKHSREREKFEAWKKLWS